MKIAFMLLGLIAAAPAWAQTPDDNPMINAYRHSNGLPDDNFMHNAYERKGYGLPDDNFARDMMAPPTPPSRAYRGYQTNQDYLSPRLDPGSPDDQD